jgi:hypothetical protein
MEQEFSTAELANEVSNASGYRGYFGYSLVTRVPRLSRYERYDSHSLGDRGDLDHIALRSWRESHGLNLTPALRPANWI